MIKVCLTYMMCLYVVPYWYQPISAVRARVTMCTCEIAIVNYPPPPGNFCLPQKVANSILHFNDQNNMKTDFSFIFFFFFFLRAK